jgi:hypothetical protein
VVQGIQLGWRSEKLRNYVEGSIYGLVLSTFKAVLYSDWVKHGIPSEPTRSPGRKMNLDLPRCITRIPSARSRYSFYQLLRPQYECTTLLHLYKLPVDRVWFLKLMNEELNELYSSLNIIRVIKSRRMRKAGRVARLGERRDLCRVLVG